MSVGRPMFHGASESLDWCSKVSTGNLGSQWGLSESTFQRISTVRKWVDITNRFCCSSSSSLLGDIQFADPQAENRTWFRKIIHRGREKPGMLLAVAWVWWRPWEFERLQMLNSKLCGYLESQANIFWESEENFLCFHAYRMKTIHGRDRKALQITSPLLLQTGARLKLPKVVGGRSRLGFPYLLHHPSQGYLRPIRIPEVQKGYAQKLSIRET